MTEEEQNQKFLPRWFRIWLYLSCLILFALGIASELGGEKALMVWGSAIVVMIFYLILLLVWKKIDSIQLVIQKVRIPLLIKFILIGVLFAEIADVLSWPVGPLFEGSTLVQDVGLTIPFYIFSHWFWFLVLRKYKFTAFGALITGGISLGIVEVGMSFMFFLGGSGDILTFLTLPLFPYTILLHGFHMVAPKMLLNKDLDNPAQKDTKWKYFNGILFPMIGNLIGVGISLLIASALGIGT